MFISLVTGPVTGHNPADQFTNSMVHLSTLHVHQLYIYIWYYNNPALVLKSKRKLFGTPWIIWIVMNSVGDVPVTPCCTKLNPSLDGLCCAPCSIVSSPSSPRSPLPASLRDLGNQKRPAGFKPFERYIDQLGIIPNIRNMNIYIYILI